MSWFRIAQDTWTSKERSIIKSGPLVYDKLQHFIGGVILGVAFPPVIATGLNGIWEIKDGLVKWEWNIKIWKYNLGGDGFSYRDLTATQIGIIIGYYVRWGVLLLI